MQVKNYTLLEVREIPELHATGYLYSHDKTKARLLYLQAPEDDNKVFSISFATIPENDCGIPHILEHCVLNGSEKYPVKEPFVDLLKGSLNTFLNAMTYPDKTMFPIASRNDKDFMNLMSVYLDAVFYPNLRKDPHIFRQEGWHYELESVDSDIVYKGVVYNEMKGAYSSGDTVLENLINKTMYPDTTYGVESGGHPDAIPDLTYEEFKAFHDRFYHPCNSYIFFYGNGNMEEHMGFVDQEYLQNFPEPKEGQVANIPMQPKFTAPKEVCDTYSVSEDEGTEQKTFLSYNVLLDPVKNATEYHLMDMLGSLLCGSEASPLKLALLKAGIGQDIDARIDVYMKQPKFSIVAKNADAEQKDQFVSIIKEQLTKIAEEGFDPKLVEATLSQNLFSLREANYGSMPKGLLYNMQGMDTWLYGGNPMDLLCFEAAFADLNADPSCFAAFVKENLLENPHTVVAVLSPEPGLNAKVDAEVKEKLAAYKASLSQAELEEMVEATKKTIARQQEPDKPEDLAKLPMLKREDLEAIKPFKTSKVVKIADRDASVYTDNANNIIYLTLSFNMDHLPEEKIPYASLLTDALSNMDTASYVYTDLDKEIGCHMGGMTVTTNLLHKLDDTFTPYFSMGAKFLKEETNSSLAILKEILLNTKLNDKQRLKEIIEENLSVLEDSMSRSGNRVASSRAMSYYNPYYAYSDKLNGVDYLWFLKDVRNRLDTDIDAIVSEMEETLEILVREGNLRIRMTIDPDNEAFMVEKLTAFTKELPAGTSDKASCDIVRVAPVKKNEGLITPGKVQYVAMAGKTDAPYTGATLVLQQITRLEYLWNNIRVMGGAYGTACSLDRYGNVVMSSYRDPNLSESLDIYQNSGNFMETFEANDSEMLKYIIGTMSGLDPVMTTSMKGNLANDALESGLTGEMLTKLSEEVMATTLEDVHMAAKALKDALNKEYICVVGSETKIKAQADLFDTTRNLF